MHEQQRMLKKSEYVAYMIAIDLQGVVCFAGNLASLNLQHSDSVLELLDFRPLNDLCVEENLSPLSLE